MPTIERWPDSTVAVLEDDGQVRLLILQQPDKDVLDKWMELYPHLPITEAACEFMCAQEPEEDIPTRLATLYPHLADIIADALRRLAEGIYART